MSETKKHMTPPKWPERLLKLFCTEKLAENLLGDMYELYEVRLKRLGKFRAQFHFLLDVLSALRPFFFKSISTNSNFISMFKNYFKTTLRSARREKAFTALNIFCLAVGLTACLYVCLYTVTELNFDKFHEKADRIYRINQTFIWGEVDEQFGSTGPAVMNAVWSEIPEFETMCRIHPLENVPLVRAVSESEKVIFEEKKIRVVDSTFFNVFTFPLLKGNPKTALTQPNSVVLTREMAMKYFKTDDVLGKQLVIEDHEVNATFHVTGVAEDMPEYSHVTFDMLISMSSIERMSWSNDSWIWTTFVTFGVLRPDADPAFVAEKVAGVPGKYLEPFLMKYRGMTYKEFLATGEPWDLYLQPLLDIHLSAGKVFSRLNETNSIRRIYIMATISGLILLLSVINFVNLTTAKSSRRSKEVGVRKVLGSNRRDLMWQFVFESVFFCVVALVMSFGLLSFFIDQFNAVSGKEIIFSSVFHPSLLTLAVGFTVLIGVLSGLYPAVYLSAFKPAKVLKSRVSAGAKGGLVRNGLVTLQFTISIALIACALIVKNQVAYWLDMDMGFNRNNIVVIQNAERLGQSMETFKNDLLALPAIKSASISSDSPPYIWDGDDNFQIQGSEQKNRISFWTADENFAEIYGLKIVAGRNFDPGKDHAISTVVTRSLVEKSGLDIHEVLGKKLIYPELEATIVGVAEDFESEINWEQLPMAIYFNHTSYYRKNREISIAYEDGLENEALSQLLTTIEDKWRNVEQGMPMNYYFLDERFRSIFESSMQFGRLINFYSILAMIIAGLGLTGLVAYVIERKTKEIGIRKVLGASVSSILVLLSGEFGRLLIIGFVLASGLSWYLMSQWVQDFTNQAPIPVYVFLVAGFAMLLVAVLTIGYQTMKAARANPVDSLRDE